MSTKLSRQVFVRGAVLAVGVLVLGAISSSGFGDGPKAEERKEPGSALKSEKEAAKPAQVVLDETQVREKIEKTLVSELTVLDFTETPLTEATNFVGSAHNFTVVIDKQALDDAGIQIDQPINCHLSGISLASALKIILHPLQLSYVVEDEVLKITTGEVAGKHLDIRVYDVRGLIDAGYQPKLLAEVITTTIDGALWKKNDGEGGSVVELPDGLVVSQTQRVHGEIVKVLKMLERHAAGKRPSKPAAQATVPSK